MLASSVVLGVAAGLASGGRLGRLAHIEIVWWQFLAVALAIRLVPVDLGPAALSAYLLAFGTILAVAVRNVRLPGMPLIAVGAALNLAVVAANGAMPVDLRAAATAGVPAELSPLHTPLGESTRLAALSDLIPVPLIARVYSVGDVLLFAGGFWLPFASMRRA